ncbi:MAG: type II toxin-antitoxin system HipA family toxin [Porphyromonas sp.]|nr:type II toxin-antitoxin system HipA family toxin [Porphyromonas sp.]
MKRIDAIDVTYHDIKVGKLTMGLNHVCLFQYDKDWLANGFSISPLKLPLRSDLFEAKYMPFYGNFGVFEDSMPGGYGEYLLHKELSRHGINYQSLSPLQKLSIVGSSGMGALCYAPITEIKVTDEEMNLHRLQQHALDVLSEKTDDGVGWLYVQSGNSGGVRPKVLLRDKDGEWLVKFRHTFDPLDAGIIEYQYNVAAREAGITVPPFKLFENRYFGVKRFDITPESERIHMVTAAGLLDESINPPKMDYKTLLSLTGFLTQDHREVEQQFRRMVFNYYAENFDDHARNFSFLFLDGRWRIAPAYDMTHGSPLGQHATTVNFKSEPTDADFVEVGALVQMSRELCMSIIEEVKPIAQQLLLRLNEKRNHI